ncbi:MAG: ATP-binding protein [Planctomycetota bacterium]|jgi:signal transduction histidine kinase
MPELSFVVDSALLSELGERLVETVHLALAELIKNSYDADATEIEVMVMPDRKYKSIITVSDNGIGMTFADVQNYWMRIATTNKVKNQVSPRYGRPKTGSKGIGRFSCRRLGNKLDLVTTGRKKDGRYETTKVEFNWNKYKPGTDVTKITCTGETRTAKEGEAGTKLIIRGGDYGEWNQRYWNTLKRQMVVLVANRGVKRKGFKEDPGFNINLAAPKFEDEIVTNTREQLMQAGWGTLKIAVDQDGTLKCSLKAKKIGERNYTHKKAYPELAGTKGEIAILPDIREQLRKPQVLSLGNLRKILPDWGGVFVRQGGFRVYPFGAPGNDWLRIDYDRSLRRGQTKFSMLGEFAGKLEGVDKGRVLLSMLSSRSYVGSVEVASPDPNLFEMKANREGFVGEECIRLLCKAVRFGIDWSTIYRDYYIRLVGMEQAEAKRREFEEATKVRTEPEKAVETAVDYVKQEVDQLAGRLPRVERQALSKAINVILQSDRAKGEELRHLRLVASTSSLMLVFAHEVRALLGDLDHYVTALGTIAKQTGGKVAHKAWNMQAEINERKQRFMDLLGMASLISVDSKKAKPEALALRDKVEKAVRCYKLVVDGYDIDIDYNGLPRKLKTGKMLEAELYSVLLNVLSNAIKAVIAGGGAKKIAITAEDITEGTRVNIMDTGVGVKVRSGDELFVPFIADPEGTMYTALKKRMNPEDEYIMGTGSGLGLSIVREIAHARGGNVAFRTAKEGWSTNLEIMLP